MENGIDKKALFKFKSEPYLKPISDLGVGFYNLDENTAILRFQLSNSKGPLLIHENNLTAYAYFESSNGSASDVVELNIEDNFNGILTVTLDKEFLQASTSTTVKGQVYIGVNNVDGSPEYNEVAVFREFTFQVADALINKISSFTKIEYIRMFSQLKERIKQQVRDIEEAIANGADYVAEMKSVLQKGVETLNAIVDDGKKDIQSYIDKTKTDLTKIKDNATEDITTVANNAKSSVQDTASTAANSINTKTTEATEHVDAKINEFNQTVEDNGFLTPDKLTEDLTALNWQKYKFTEDDGTIKYYTKGTITDITELPPGLYETVSDDDATEQGIPLNNSYVQIKVWEAGSGRKEIELTSTFNSEKYFRLFHTDGTRDSGWKKISNDQTDTGWIPFNLINGAKTNSSYDYGGPRNGFGCAYRTIKRGDVTERHLRINGSNVKSGQVIAQLPPNFCKNVQVGFIRAPLAHNGTSIIIENTGEVKVYINNSEEWSSDDGHYLYGEISWLD